MIKPSVGLLAVRAISDLLVAIGSPAPVMRADTVEYTPERLPAYNVFRRKDRPEYDGDQRAATCKLDIVVRCMVSAVDDADEAVDPLIVWAWQQIMRDPTLGSLVLDATVTDVEYQYLEKSAYVQLAADLTIEVTVDVGRSDPTQNLTYL